jgi:hypothetical protein
MASRSSFQEDEADDGDALLEEVLDDGHDVGTALPDGHDDPRRADLRGSTQDARLASPVDFLDPVSAHPRRDAALKLTAVAATVAIGGVLAWTTISPEGPPPTDPSFSSLPLPPLALTPTEAPAPTTSAAVPPSLAAVPPPLATVPPPFAAVPPSSAAVPPSSAAVSPPPSSGGIPTATHRPTHRAPREAAPSKAAPSKAAPSNAAPSESPTSRAPEIVASATLSRDVLRLLKGEGYASIDAVVCPAIAARVGAMQRCQFKAGDDSFGGTVLVTAVRQADISWHVELDGSGEDSYGSTRR